MITFQNTRTGAVRQVSEAVDFPTLEKEDRSGRAERIRTLADHAQRVVTALDNSNRWQRVDGSSSRRAEDDDE